MTRMCRPTVSQERGYSGPIYPGLRLGSIRITGYSPRRHRSRETNCHSMRRGAQCSVPQFDIGTLEFEDAEGIAADKKAILFDDNTIGVKTRSVRGIQLVGGFAISIFIKT